MPVNELRPRVGTIIANHGRVVSHEVSRYGLHRMRVTMINQYPDLQTWAGLLPEAAFDILHRYTESAMRTGDLICNLDLYWKE